MFKRVVMVHDPSDAEMRSNQCFYWDGFLFKVERAMQTKVHCAHITAWLVAQRPLVAAELHCLYTLCIG